MKYTVKKEFTDGLMYQSQVCKRWRVGEKLEAGDPKSFRFIRLAGLGIISPWENNCSDGTAAERCVESRGNKRQSSKQFAGRA